MFRLTDLREILRYIPEFRDRSFVIAIDGAVVADENFQNYAQLYRSNQQFSCLPGEPEITMDRQLLQIAQFTPAMDRINRYDQLSYQPLRFVSLTSSADCMKII